MKKLIKIIKSLNLRPYKKGPDGEKIKYGVQGDTSWTTSLWEIFTGAQPRKRGGEE